MHQESSDSLFLFCKLNNSRVVMRKSSYNNEISFVYWSFGNSEGNVIKYDSLLKRNDPYPERTLQIKIPVGVINDFRKSIYLSVRADSIQVFFGYKYYPDGNYQYGILINSNKKRIEKNAIKVLSSNAYICKGIIP